MYRIHRTLRSLSWAALSVSLVGAASAEEEAAPGLEDVVPGAPTFREVLSLADVGQVAIAPDGSRVAYTVRSTEWDENRYDTEIWMVSRAPDGSWSAPFQLTRTPSGSSTSPDFSPDGRWLAFLAARKNGGPSAKTQVHRIALAGGEARAVTSWKEGVGAFRWSPDSTRIAFTAAQERSEEHEARVEAYGRFRVEDEDLRPLHLFIQDLEPGQSTDPATSAADEEPRRLTSGDLHVTGFEFAPDGESIAISHWPSPQIDMFPRGDISLVDLASGELRGLVSQPGGDGLGVWSPDGRALFFQSPMGGDDYYGNTQTARVEIETGTVRSLTSTFDEDTFAVAAHEGVGILFTANERTRRSLFRLDPETEAVQRLDLQGTVVGSVALSRDGSTLAWTAYGGEQLSEVYVAGMESLSEVVKVTDMTVQTEGWPLGTRELVTWTSRDGAEIEGVLSLPDGHERSQAAPLLVVIHGGPTGTSRPDLVGGYVYPMEQWLARGALILQPNYRGSAGYGGAFRALNVRNLGVGDAWDVESGVEALIERGLVDPDRVGAMGWSQGGYISAFLATNSTKFRAISNGAGISNWMTYYVNTDIHGFTRAYLEATPWDDPEIYAKTSPMTNITQAATPTLIQHGENDARVPVPNAFELYQGLQDQGVPTRLILYEDFGHGIVRPKERLAAVWHNWQWFEKWIWGRDVELPVEVEAEDSGKDANDSQGASN